MKELTIEQKAKRFDEAIAMAKECITYVPDKAVNEYMLNMFPELAESEYEKIRKELIAMVKLSCTNGDDVDKKIAWLEKQCEQKVNEIYPIFRVGDYIRNKKTNNKVLIKQLDIKSKAYYYTSYDGAAEVNSDFSFYEQDKWELIGQKIIEQKPDDKVEKTFKIDDWVVCEAAPRYTAFEIGDVVQISSKETLKIFLMFKDCFRLWTIQDAKDGDVLCYKDEISLYKHDIKNCAKQETTFGGFVYHCCYDGKRFIMDSLYSLTEQDKMDIHPATKEQRDALMKAMADAGYTFDFEKKELRKLEPKSSEWREEDKELMKWSINNLTELKDRFGEEYGKVGDCINWLKSLKPQTKQDWSQNDIDMIDWLIRCCENEHEELCNDKYGHQDIVSDLKRDCRKKWDWLESLKNRVVPQSKWKPSDKQMKALGVATNISNVPEKEYQELEKLYQDLLKLREE